MATKQDAAITLDSLAAMIDERDKRYAERFKDHEDRFAGQEKAVAAALAAQEKAVAAALAAQEKAVSVAEDNSKNWRSSANEWRDAMNDREKNFMPRSEAGTEFANIREKMSGLVTRLDRGEGATSGVREHSGDSRAILSIIAAAIIAGMAVWTFLGKSYSQPPQTPQIIYVPSPPGTLLPSTPPQPVPR